MECKMPTLWKCFHRKYGFGDVKVETEHFVIVLFEKDPQTFVQLDKEDKDLENTAGWWVPQQ